MNSPLALFLAGAGGICLLVGGWYSTAGIKEPERWQSVALRLFGAACLGLPATVIVLNLASPTTMHFSDLIEVGGVALPWGERLTQATAIPSRWPPLADYLIIVFGGLCAYALWTDSGRSGGRSRAPLEAGLAFLIATIAVELLDPRRVSALPVDEFGFFAFVIVLGFGLRQDLVDGPYRR